MRRILSAFILFLFVQFLANAQGPIYLPLILGEVPMKNGWQIIAPQATTNMVLNPSAETTGNFAAVGAATITQPTTYQKYGLNSYRVQTAANGQGIELALSPLTNAAHYVTARIKGKLPTQWGFSLSASPYVPPVLLENLGEGWSLYGLEFGANVANGKTFLRVGQLGPGSGDFYLDGVQVEAGGDPTTYCDGTQEGCAWNGPANAATSTRSAESRAGGLVKDFYDDYGFFVEKIVGAGATTQTLSIDEYALLPGGELNSIKTDPRQMTIIGKFIGASEKDLHDKRQALLVLLSDESYPENQPVKIRFTGGSVPKEIGVFYQSGLEGELEAFYCEFAPEGDNQWARVNQWIEKCAIQFSAPDPFWYEVGESAVQLDTADSAFFYTVAGRLKSTEQWTNLGPPNIAGTYSAVYAIAEDNTYIYFGGDFLNFDNIPNADYIVRYNKQTGVYSALGTGTNGIVWSLIVGADGTLYLGGDFTLAGGVANTAKIASWDGTTFAPLDVGVSAGAGVYALAIGLNGTLYAGGGFIVMSGVANTTRLAAWDGTAWSALSTGANNTVQRLAIGLGGILYIGGLFTSTGGVADTTKISSWNGMAFLSLGTGADDTVWALAVGTNGILYLGGDFTTVGGVSAAGIASWNGTAFNPLGSGVNDTVYNLAVGPDGMLYAGGIFTSAGGITLNDRVVRWNGYSYAHLDIDLPGTPTVWGMLASRYADSVIPQKYDLFLGFTTTGVTSYGGKVTASNAGSALAFPKIVYGRFSGLNAGVSAIVETLKNERTGKELLFNYALLPGETLAITLEPAEKNIVSTQFGSRLDAILPNSDFGNWTLLPGDNTVTSFIRVDGGPGLTRYMIWKDKYKSWD